MNALSRDGMDIYDGLKEPKKKYDEAVARLEEYFVGRSSMMLQRKLFFNSKQGANESVADFAGRLRRISADCDFADAAEMCRDIFVFGVSNDRLGERLLAEDPKTLTFNDAVTKAETFERATAERN